MKTVPPWERTRAELAALFEAGTSGDPQAELVRLAVRRIVEEALEATARDVLQRDYYARSQGDTEGWRNGYRDGSPGHRRRRGEIQRAPTTRGRRHPA